MRKFLLIISLINCLCVSAQYSEIIKNLEQSKNDSVRINLLRKFYENAFELPMDSMTHYYTTIKTIGRKQNDKIVEALNMSQMGYYLYLHGQLPQGLRLATDALHIGESTNNPRVLGMITFGLQYFTSDNNKRIDLIRKAITYSRQANDLLFLTYENRNLGHIYFALKNVDSTFYYYQRSYDLARKTNEATDIAGGLTGLGRANYLLGNKKISLEFFKSAAAIPNTNAAIIAATYYEIAHFFLLEKIIDSAIFYSKVSYERARGSDFINNIAKSARTLKDLYMTINSDSALKYTNIYHNAVDSMYAREKVEQVQALNFDEEIRQQNIKEEKLKAVEERKKNIQYALLALSIITFIILFLLLSRSFITNEKVIRFFGIVALLLVFEFLNLLLHPYLERITHHSPVLMLLALVCIAALLVPAHHQLEKWMTHTMVEKNRKIRLAAAKKTIEKLEKNI